MAPFTLSQSGIEDWVAVELLSMTRLNHSTAQYSTGQLSMAQHAQHSTAQHGWHGAIQTQSAGHQSLGCCGAAQHDMLVAKHRTAQDSIACTAQHG